MFSICQISLGPDQIYLQQFGEHHRTMASSSRLIAIEGSAYTNQTKESQKKKQQRKCEARHLNPS